MTHEQLLPMYQQATGLPGSDEAYNQWVQKIIDASGSQQGTAGIPDNFFQTPQGQAFAPAVQSGTGAVGGAIPPGVGQLGGLTDLVDSQNANKLNSIGAANEALNAGASRAISGGNTNQVQGSDQTGQYVSGGSQEQTTTQNQNVTGSTTQNQNTTGNQATTGTTAQQTTGTQATDNTATTTGGTQSQQQQIGQTTGTTQQTTGVVDNLGLSDLVRQQTGAAGAADATRNAELTKIATQGGAGLQSQLDQAIRNSRTGQQMVGAGSSANDRAAGYAAAEVGRHDLDARLGALSQLAGPSATGTLVGSSTPLLGSTTSGSNTGTSQTSTLGSELQNLVNTNKGTTTNNQSTAGQTAENVASNQQQGTTGTTAQNTTGEGTSTDVTKQGGSAIGSNLSVATGQTPQQTSSGGGCFVASALCSLHLIGPRGIRHAVQYKLRKSKFMPIGYALYGPWLAKQTLKSTLVRRLMLPVVRGILYEELRLSGRVKGKHPARWTTHFLFHYGSATLGLLASLVGAKFETKDADLRNLLQQHNLYFN